MDPLRQEGGKGGTDKAAAPGDIRNIIAALDERNPKPGYGINKNNLGLVEKYLQNTLSTRDNFFVLGRMWNYANKLCKFFRTLSFDGLLHGLDMVSAGITPGSLQGLAYREPSGHREILFLYVMY
jgi:hypothetical protein